jgi:hypothetical protein
MTILKTGGVFVCPAVDVNYLLFSGNNFELKSRLQKSRVKTSCHFVWIRGSFLLPG